MRLGGAAVCTVWSWRERSRQRRALDELDDRLLRERLQAMLEQVLADDFHPIRALDGQAGKRAAGAAAGSPARGKSLAGTVTGIVARIAAAFADELRIRRDMRQLRAMDDCMLKDIGLTRADVGGAVRYGRD